MQRVNLRPKEKFECCGYTNSQPNRHVAVYLAVYALTETREALMAVKRKTMSMPVSRVPKGYVRIHTVSEACYYMPRQLAVLHNQPGSSRQCQSCPLQKLLCPSLSRYSRYPAHGSSRVRVHMVLMKGRVAPKEFGLTGKLLIHMPHAFTCL